MKPRKMTWLSTVLAACMAATPAWSATICGEARSPQGPAGGVQVLVKDSNGQVLGQTTTDSNGNYLLDGVNSGTVDLFLEPGTTGFKGGSGVLTLTDAGSKVDWQVSDASNAAAAQDGVCDPAGGWTNGEIASVALIGAAALGAGLGLGFGTGPDHNHPTSPQK